MAKNNSLIKNVVFGLGQAMLWGYGVMSIIWLATGLKHDASYCIRIYTAAVLMLFAAVVVSSVVLFVMRRSELNSIIDKMTECKSISQRQALIDRLAYYLDGNINYCRYVYAACCLEGGRYIECREIISKTDISKLSCSEQEECFNICLYSALLEEKNELAAEIYAKSKHYFDRATMRKGRGGILHTLGLLCLAEGKYDNAEALFKKAKKEHKRSLKCECDLGLAEISLKRGDWQAAREYCKSAAENTETFPQADRLKKAMQATERLCIDSKQIDNT